MRGIPMTVKPSITIQLAPSRLMPSWVRTGFGASTITPGSALNTIGFVAVPLVVRLKPA